MTPAVRIEALGQPAPKGSGRAILIAGRARHVPSGSNVNRRNLQSWDSAVRAAALTTIGRVNAPPFVGQALRVAIVFRLARPGGHWGKRGIKPSKPLFPIGKPDVDKLARATVDSLIGTVFDDDSRIVSLDAAKVWAAPGNEGASIVVEERTADAAARQPKEIDR
ncbi:MAG: RusA family crossover junction endodeoxyribonuclease [Chloroflexota bacterium]